MAQATFVQDGKSIDYTPSAAVVNGQVVVQGSLVAIANGAIAASALGSLATTGIFDVVQAAMTFAVGQAVYWDADGDPVGGTAGTGAATETATANTFMGYALAATIATDATVRIILRSKEDSAAETLTLAQLGDVGATAYTAGKVLVADGNSYEEVAVSGDGTLSAAGVLAITGFAAMPTVPVAAKTATGSTQAHALAAPTAVLAAGMNVVAAADGTKAVALPVAAAGKVVILKNNANAVLKLFPNTDDAINAVAANASMDIAALTAAMLIASDATTWFTLPLLPS